MKKVKMVLKQPPIKCSGRDDVTCYYRGKIIDESDVDYLIEFKHNGEVKKELYHKSHGFYNVELSDIKIKE